MKRRDRNKLNKYIEYSAHYSKVFVLFPTILVASSSVSTFTSIFSFFFLSSAWSTVSKKHLIFKKNNDIMVLNQMTEAVENTMFHVFT